MDLAELSVPSLAASLGLEVGLEVREAFVYPGLVTDTGDPTAVWVTQGRHQVVEIIVKVGMSACPQEIITERVILRWCRYCGPRRVWLTTEIFVSFR